MEKIQGCIAATAVASFAVAVDEDACTMLM
jgi:hypothetical protein